ncbi:MAG: hypothetical protein U0821_27520 [Chloroflexota bacterium]
MAMVVGVIAALTTGSVTTLAGATDASSVPFARSLLISDLSVVRDSSAPVFTVGAITQIESETKLTIRLSDDSTKTFKIDSNTVIRNQSGEQQGISGLEVGETVVVVTKERDSESAVAIMEGGPPGFPPTGTPGLRWPDERGPWADHGTPGIGMPRPPMMPGGGPPPMGTPPAWGTPPPFPGPGGWKPGEGFPR